MGKITGISWTDHTFNPWWGCTRVDAGCVNCNAETLARRFGTKRGVEEPRRTFGEKHWNEPINWNRAAIRDGRLHRVFCASMADVFDVDAPAGELDRLWKLIKATPWLSWQLLTKRAERIAASLPADWDGGYENVWLGVTVATSKNFDRVATLKDIPAFCRFISYEPALEDVTFDLTGIHWVIVGGESGDKARPFDPEWARHTIRQCQDVGIACFVKQMGSNPVGLTLKDGHGADDKEWNADLIVKQFPEGL